jgi:hypothetical protein
MRIPQPIGLIAVAVITRAGEHGGNVRRNIRRRLQRLLFAERRIRPAGAGELQSDKN